MSWADYKISREKMVQEQLIKRGITDQRVIAAMLEIPRHLFLDEEAGPQAYSDHAFPIGYSQTITTYYLESHWVMLVPLLAILLVLVIKPSGLFGEQKKLEERI